MARDARRPRGTHVSYADSIDPRSPIDRWAACRCLFTENDDRRAEEVDLRRGNVVERERGSGIR